MTRGRLRLVALAACACLAPAAACADPVSLAVAAAWALGASQVAMIAIAVVGAVYGASDARRRARHAAADARNAYNASLQDRTATLLQASPPQRVVYGRCRTGGDIVAEITTDKLHYSYLGSRGYAATTVTKPDAYKHLVIVVAAHEVQAINEVYINGIPVGALNAGGWAIAGPADAPWGKPRREVVTTTLTFTAGAASISLASGYTATQVLKAWTGGGRKPDARDGYYPIVYAPGVTTIGPTGVISNTAAISGAYQVSVEVEAADSAVRWSGHTGTATQTVDAYLQSVAFNLLAIHEWDTNHRLRGLAYVVLTLDLEDSRFTGGPPQIDFDITGAKLLDPRTGTTAWSDNPALAIYDWLRAPWGLGVAAGDIDTASVNAAATACEVPISLTVGASTETGQPTYTCNGAFTTADAKESVLEDLVNSMAGTATCGAQWRIQAGAWAAPVMDLSDDDAHGPIQVVQAAVGLDDAINGLRATYIPAGEAAPQDAEPYSNATFVAADGVALWGDVALPYTNHKARAKNLQRIRVEANRCGMVVQYPAALRAWPLQVGDRVRVSSAEYAWVLKTFRVTDWQFDLAAPVLLTLQEDVAGTWDLADAAVADPAPDTEAASPWVVADPTGVAAASGTAQLLLQADGAIVTRVLVSWDARTGAHMAGGSARTEVRWAAQGSQDWRVTPAEADALSAYITGVAEGVALVIGVRHVNALGIHSAWAHVAHIPVGKSALPANVAGLTATAGAAQVRVAWTACAEIDYFETEVRQGASWAAGTRVFAGPADSYNWPAATAGAYTLWAKHRDTSGNESATAASVGVTVTMVASVLNTAVTTSNPVTSGNASSYIGTGAVASGMVADLRTSNYAENGSAQPTAGAKLASTGTALKVASGSLQVGTAVFTDYWYRLVNAIDGGASGGGTNVVWRGNNDTSTLGGAPNIDCLSIRDCGVMDPGNTGLDTMLVIEWGLQPTAITDNLDSMRYMDVDVYVNAGGASPLFSRRIHISDRLYANSTHSDSSNAVYGSGVLRYRNSGSVAGVLFVNTSPYTFNGHLLVTLHNAYGASAQKWFHGYPSISNALNTLLLANTTPPSGAPSGGGGGGGGSPGGGCPAPWVRLALVGGREIDAGQVYDGARVVAVHDGTLAPIAGGGVVRRPAVIWRPRIRLVLQGGAQTEWSADHRFCVVGKGWRTVQRLVRGDVIAGLAAPTTVESIAPTGEGPVVTFTVEGAGTYFGGGLLSHNRKIMDP